MGKRIPIPFAIQTNDQSEARSLSAQRLVNWCAEKQEEGSKAPVALIPTSGLTLSLDLSALGECRGLTVMSEILYGVFGSSFVSIASPGTSYTVLGTLLSTRGPVYMAASATQVVLIDTSYGYGYSVANGFLTITDPDFEASSSITYQDGYFIFTKAGTDGQWFISDLLNGTSYDALNFATAESSPDKLLWCVSDHRELFLFGSRTVEVWRDTGGTFPFERVTGGIIERGTLAGRTVVKMDSSIIFVGDDRSVYRVGDGYNPMRISGHAIDRKIKEADAARIFAYTYYEHGHAFYLLTMPDLGLTLAYDASTQVWHERAELVNGEFTHWRPNVTVLAYDKTFTGDLDGKLYEIDQSTTYAGDVIKRLAVSSPLFNTFTETSISKMIVDFQTGDADATGQGSDPHIMLRVSRDGGYSYGNERTHSLSLRGERSGVVSFRRLGQFKKSMTFELSLTDPVRSYMQGAYLDLEAGV